MRVTAELRWFWPEVCSGPVRAWFDSGPVRPGGGERHRRVDRYFAQAGATEVGLKLRAAEGPTPQAELKGLVGALPSAEPVAGAPAVQIWCKWNVVAAPSRGIVDVTKVRWLRKFKVEAGAAVEVALDAEEQPLAGGLPEVGCDLELTRLQALGRTWETVGFEAFGDLVTAPAALQACLRALRPLPAFDGAFQSYPEWLAALPSAPAS